MLGSRRLVLAALVQVLVLPSIFGDDRLLLKGSFKYVSSVIQGLPKEAWEGSYRGGYLFRFQIDVMGDDTAEVFLGSSLRSQTWAVFDDHSRFLGEVRAGLGTLRVRRSGGGTSLLDTYQQSASEKYINEFFIGPEGVENRSRQVESPADESEYEFIASNEAIDRGIETVNPDIEYIRLSDFIDRKNDEWKPLDVSDWMLTNGYFIHRDDAEIARGIRTASDEGFIKDAMGGFTHEVALSKLRASERVGRQNGSEKRSRPQLAKTDRGEVGIDPSTRNQPSSKRWPVVVAMAMLGLLWVWLKKRK